MTRTAYTSSPRNPGKGQDVLGRGQTPALALDRAREARRESTEAEDKLWGRLRDRRLQGFKFRRQPPLGLYRPDFVCPSAGLIVELDGSQHVDAQAYDNARTRFFESEGYRVMRVWNNDVLARTDAVLEAILAALMPSHPLPEGERDRRAAPG